MQKLLEAVWDFIDAVLDLLPWRDDWRRTWSPASYWLAVIGALTLAFMTFLYGRTLLEYAKGHFSP
jgi:hypothetical protein